NVDNGGTVRNFGGSADFLYAVGVSADGAVVAAGGEEGIVRLYNGGNGTLLKALVPPGVELPGAKKETATTPLESERPRDACASRGRVAKELIMSNVWKIAPGLHAEDWEVFRKQGCIGIGWLELENLRRFRNKEAILSELELQYGKNTPGCKT